MADRLAPLPASILRIFLIEHLAPFRSVMTRLLSDQADMELVGMACDGEEALAQLSHLGPHVILLDLNRAGLNDIPRLRAAAPEAKIIGLPLLAGIGYRRAALRAGADDCVVKLDVFTELMPTLRRVTGNSASITT